MKRLKNSASSRAVTIVPVQSDVRKDIPALACVLAVVVFALYCRVWDYAFILLDDPPYIYENAGVMRGLTWQGVMDAFVLNTTMYYSPLTLLSFMLDATIYGKFAGGYHLTNVIFHAINVVLLFYLVLVMLKDQLVAFAVAMLFAVHPMHVESVAWATARKDVLSMFFGLLALHGYLGWVNKPTWKAKALVYALYGASLLAKPMFVVMAGLLLLLDYWPLKRLGTDGYSYFKPGELFLRLREKWVFLLMGTLSALTTIYSHPPLHGTMLLSLENRLANAVVSYVTYLRKLVLPYDLAIMYPFPASINLAEVALSASILALLTFLVVWQVRRRPYLLFCWLWYLVGLLPVIVVPKVGISVALSDRWAYLPYWGPYLAITLLVVDGVRSLPQAQKPLRFVGFAVLAPYLVLAWLCLVQISTWRDSVTVFERSLAVTKDNYFIMNHLGVAHMSNGRAAAAEELFRKALVLVPEFADALANMGLLYSGQGRYQEAIEYFKQAIAVDGANSKALAEDYYGIGYCFAQMRLYDQAEQNYKKAIELKPDYAMPYNDLGNIAMLRGNLVKALDLYERAVKLAPDYGIARQNMLQVKRRIEGTG